MAQTYLGSTLRTGTDALSDTANGGFVVVSQTTTVTTVAAGTVTSATVTLPKNSQIIDLIVDGIVDIGQIAGTATTCPIKIGLYEGGTNYVSATDAFNGGRIALAFTTDQCSAMSDVGIVFPQVVITAEPNGTIDRTQGVFRMTVVYAQKV